MLALHAFWAMGEARWLGVKVRDATGRVFDVELAPQVDWAKAWKPVSAWLPQEAVAPLTLVSLYVSETRPEAKPVGDLYFDDIYVAAAPPEKETAPAAK